jgi:Ni,Fe-hydrogenase III large subunit
MTFPLGPYHPALPEPLSLRLALRGETVTGVETHTGYIHRGIASLATQRDLNGTLDLLERTCGTCGYSHRLALCLALEAYTGVTPPPRARAVRTLFAEVERALDRLWMLMQIGRASELGTLFTAAVESREMLFEACVAATGTESRLFWGVAVPGGVTNTDDVEAFSDQIPAITAKLVPLTGLLGLRGPLANRSKMLAAFTTASATDLGLSGLLLRATGAEDDVRIDAPYDAYADQAKLLTSYENRPGQLSGDISSRAQLALAETQTSLRIILNILEDLPAGQEQATFSMNPAPGVARATIEGPHGRETLVATLGGTDQRLDLTKPGWLTALDLRTPSAVNIGIVPIILNALTLRDVPLALASLDLCVACVDL